MRLRASSKDPKDEEKLPSTRKKQGSDVPIRQLTVVVSRLQTAHSNMITPVSSADNPTPLSSLLKNKQVCKWFEIQEYEADMIRIAKERLGKMGVSDDGKRKYILDISSLDQSFVKQQEVIHELIQTERDYLSDLKMVSNLFISKMHDKAILPVSDIQTVFSNWTALIPIHEAFLSFLEQRKRNGLGFVKNISGVVCDLGLMLGSAYETYCVNHPGAMAFLEGSEKNEKLHVYLQLCQFRPETRGLNLVSFLLLPIQRLCKYPLLLKELIKNTSPTDSEYANLEKALASLSAVVGQINDGKREMEQTRDAEQLLASVDPKDVPIDLSLARRLLHRGPVLKLSSTTLKDSGSRDLCLFTDALITLKKPSHFSRLLVIANSWQIDSLSVSFDQGQGIFVIHQPREKRYCFSVKTEYEKKGWLDAFSGLKVGITIQEASPVSASVVELGAAEGTSTSTLCLSKPSIVGSNDATAIVSKSIGELASNESLSAKQSTVALDGKRTPPPLLPKPKRDLLVTKDFRGVSPAIDSAKVISPFNDQTLLKNTPLTVSVPVQEEPKQNVKAPPVPLTPSPISQGMPPAVPLRALAKNPAFQFFDSLADKGPPPLPRSVTAQPLSPSRRRV